MNDYNKIFNDIKKQYPKGVLNNEDEGELKMAFSVDPKTKTLIINFGKPLAWVGFKKEEVEELIKLLTKLSKQL
jgi:hypothetical protein